MEEPKDVRLSTMQSDSVMTELEPHRLYAVLTYRGDPALWHWAFHVPDPSKPPIGSEGTLFNVERVVSAAGPLDDWKFESRPRDVISSHLVVAIVRLCDIGFLGTYEEAVGKDGLIPILDSVPRPPATDYLEFSSRSWFLNAIEILQDCGIGTCDDVWLLEREIRRFAFRAMDKYLQNKGWTAYKSQHCT